MIEAVLPAAGRGLGRERAAAASRARRRCFRGDVGRRPRARVRRREGLYRHRREGSVRRLPLRAADRDACRGDRGGCARPAAHRRRERRRGEAPRTDRRPQPRDHRLRLAGRGAGRRDPGGRADDRARCRLLPHARRGSRAFCSATGAEPGESHRDAAEQDIVVTATSSRDPVLRGEWLRDGALVCAMGANRPRGAGARQRRARTGDVRLLRLARERAARVGRPDRARRERRARLARGARAPGGRRRRAPGPADGRRHRRSSSRTGSPRGTSRSAPRWSSERASAASAGSSRPRSSGARRRSCRSRSP